MSVDPDTIQDLSYDELLAEWYLAMHKYHIYQDLRNKATKEHELKALIQPFIRLKADRDLILHEIERRFASLERKDLLKPELYHRMN